ncbi:SDR family oxidoreductase [Candidatus Woesebacteria bacterium]|nr:SDR family oxidoreductase [Candidatus Woesebacteria bacterium]
MRLKDKVVVITGSSSGIGEATAYAFAKEGAKVVVNSKSNISGGKKVLEKIKKEGGEAIYIQADVSNPKQAKTLIDKTVKKYGTLDILINNAGGYESANFLTASKDHYLKIFDNNLFGTINCSQYAAKIMLAKGGGKILNTASVYGLEHTGDPGGMAYSIAKAAVISLTKNLAKLWSPKILVNAVAPGYVHIRQFNSIPKKVQKEMIAEMRLRRWIEPAEIAEAFLLLAKNDAITGEVLVVDAGFTLK